MPASPWFSRALLTWYRENHRALPWRSNKNPYRIWLSEVILQQTRVDQGMAYWHRFVEHFPTVKDLAEASEDDVLKLWQGLGYYSRARNLLAAAEQVMRIHGGAFPTTYAELLGLKGVGEYTAAAIGSIAFGLPEPVVDGNVYRVLARVFGIGTPIDSTAGRKEFRALAATLMDTKQPGDHNQAVMELGATICTPKKPQCTNCPIATKCVAFATERIVALPVKAGRTVVSTRHFNYLHIRVHKGTYLRKRTGKGIWQGLYEFPQLETDRELKVKAFTTLLQKEYGPGWTIIARYKAEKHILSHQVIHAVFWEVKTPTGFLAPMDWVSVRDKDVANYALPRLMERYLD